MGLFGKKIRGAAFATLQPWDACTIWTSSAVPADSADGWPCGQPAVRAIVIGCPCGHALTGLECDWHAANTDRLAAGQDASPNVCAACNREGHFCPADITTA